MSQSDYYKLFGLPRDASAEVIKRAYRRLARLYHPDVSKEADAEVRFKELNKAYDILKDPRRRAAYDAKLKARAQARPAANQTRVQRPAAEPRRAPASEASPIGDIFNAILSGNPFKRRAKKETPPEDKPNGKGHNAKIRVSLEDACRGAVRTVELRVPRQDSKGRLNTQTRRLNVRIPKGVQQGQQLRLTGQAAATLGREQEGDLYLDVEFEPHAFFRVEGADIHLTLPITPWEAALGASVKAPTVLGTVDLKVPAGSQSGQKLRLKGRGLPSEVPGDQIITLSIVTPEANSISKREFYARMADEMPIEPRKHLGV